MGPRTNADGTRAARGRSLLAALVVLAAVLLAGCTTGLDTGAPRANDSPTESNGTELAPDDTVPAESGVDDAETAESPTLASVEIDANATWNRTLALLDVEAERPPVNVRNGSPPAALAFDAPEYVDAFAGETQTPQPAAWYDPRSGTVTIRTEALKQRSPASVEATLAHEYAHAVQFQRGWDGPNRSRTDRIEPQTTELYVEGMASYVQASYGQAYLENESAWTPENRSAGDAIGERFVRTPYVEGARYYDERLASPQQLPDVVDDPPATSEQALHGTDDRPRPLSVDLQYDIQNVSATYGQPRGELAIREVLRSAVAPDRAAAAAAGWGNDDLLSFHHPGREQRGYVWVHRWDDAAEADEFQRTARDLFEQRRTESEGTAFALRRLAPETTVLLAATNGALDDVSTVADGNGSVTVSVPD